MQGLPLAEAQDRVRNDQEHRMIHFVQLLMQPGKQRSVSAPASSSGSSSSAKRSAAALSDVKALTSKVDELASTVKLFPDKSSSGGKGRNRSRSSRGSKKTVPRGQGGKGKAKGEKQEVENNNVERRLLGKNFLLFWRIQLAAIAKHAGGVDGRRRDEAAAKNGYHERSDEENQIQRKNGCQEPTVGG